MFDRLAQFVSRNVVCDEQRPLATQESNVEAVLLPLEEYQNALVLSLLQVNRIDVCTPLSVIYYGCLF